MIKLKNGAGLLCVACSLHTSSRGMPPGKQIPPAVGEKWQPAPPLTEQVFTDANRGNWYYKREYYRKARQQYEVLRKKVDELDKLKSAFFEKRAHADKQVDTFNAKLGFEEGRIDELLSELAEKLASERVEMIELSEEERNLERKIKEKSDALEQLKLDLSTVSQLDSALDDSIGVVLQVMDKGRAFQEKGWQSYNDIGQQLNDRMAEVLYKSIQTDTDNVEGLSRYLTRELEPFFNKKINELQNLMQKVHQSVNQLEMQEVYLSKELAQQVALDKKRKEEEMRQEELARKAAQEKAAVPQGWWARLKNRISSIGRWLKSTLFGSAATEQKKTTSKASN